MIRIITVSVLILIVLSPLVAPYDPLRTDPANQLQPPSTTHALGTDFLGRDVLSRALYGGQRTLTIALLATVIALVPGITIGLLSGLSTRWFDQGIQIGINAVLAFPGLVLALVVLTLAGAGVLPLALATGVMQIAPVARVVRAAVLEVRGQLYMEAAVSLGARRVRCIVYYVLPNIQTPLLAYAVVVFSFSVLNNAALSFLGLGGDPSAPDWGVMLSEGRAAFRAAPWIGIAPGIGIAVVVMLFNAVARSLTDANQRR